MPDCQEHQGTQLADVSVVHELQPLVNIVHHLEQHAGILHKTGDG